jgi:flavodoxin
MRTLIVYFSKFGKNKALAEEIQAKISGRLEEIVEKKPRTGFGLFVVGGFQAFFKKEVEIIAPKADPASYDLTIIVSPVWAGHLPPATRRYLKQMGGDFNDFAYISVCANGEKNGESFAEDLTEAAGKKPKVLTLISEKEYRENKYSDKLDDFLDELI